ncbi:MAG: macro domain-containing protein, partial [Candidatus Omnitrophica bacterium]|nr:macro domain-containing protein [Candidatus Omnitrophota bacterium]
MKIQNTELKIVKADITELSVDAIVNPANNQLVMGGGVAGVIRKKGGIEIENEAVRKGPIKIGESIVTKAGTLKCRYVIHAATMGMDFKTDQDKVRAATASALQCAEELKLKSVALPALGCGTGGFPLLGAAKIMAQEVLKFVRQKKNVSLSEIIFCLHDDEAYKIFDKAVFGYVRHIQEDLGLDP